MALDVALKVRPESDLGAGVFAVTVRICGGTAPLRLLLYCDGTLAGACDSVADVYEFRAALHPGARHGLTARVIDAGGRWGGASTAVGHPRLARAAVGRQSPARPAFTLRSSVRTRSPNPVR